MCRQIVHYCYFNRRMICRLMSSFSIVIAFPACLSVFMFMFMFMLMASAWTGFWRIKRAGD